MDNQQQPGLPSAQPPRPAISDAERRQILHNILMMEASQGNRIVWVGQYQAHFWRMPAPVNNLLHGVLSLLTFGLWLIVWILALATQPKPVFVGVVIDEQGQPWFFDPPLPNRR